MTRPKGSGNIPWDAIIERARAHPDQWIMPTELAAVSTRTIQVIRKKERRQLRLDDGIIRVRARAGGGELPVTLAIKFDPKEST